MSEVFFLIGCPRSATTAYTRILDLATNAEVFVEQAPKLRIVSRKLLDGNLEDPASVLRAAKEKYIKEVLARGLKYSDKSPCYMPFIPYLVALWDAKIVFLVRDGRDVVRSLIGWHDQFDRNTYAMAEDEEGSPRSRPEDDPWDYSRQRPVEGDPLRAGWKSLSRFEKCAWYWAKYNEVALDLLSRIDSSKWMYVDVDRADVDTVESIFEFLGLEGFDRDAVSTMLTSRINSVADRTGIENVFPDWSDWTGEQKSSFDEFAGDMMARLKYY